MPLLGTSFFNFKERPIRSKDFIPIKTLREGPHTQIIVAQWKTRGNQKVVIKKMDETKIKKWVITSEITSGKKLKHNNIAKFHGFYRDKDYICLVFEYIAGQDLFDYLEGRNFSPISETRAKEILKQLVHTLLYVHKKGIVHRDLKVSHIKKFTYSKS